MPYAIIYSNCDRRTLSLITSIYTASRTNLNPPKNMGRQKCRPRFMLFTPDYFIIAAATFLNALTSASMCSRVYVGWVQKEIVASAREFAISQLNFV